MSRIKRKQIDLTLSQGDGYGIINVPGLENADMMEEAFDKVTIILDKLAPPKPPKLNDSAMSLSLTNGSTIAKQSGTGTAQTQRIFADNTLSGYDRIYISYTHTKHASVSTASNNKFYISDESTESLSLDLLSGSTPFNSGVSVLDIGTVGTTFSATQSLTINYYGDYFSGVSGKSDFWLSYGLTSSVLTRTLTAGSTYSVRVLHKDNTGDTGDNNQYTFGVDRSTAPSVTASSLAFTGSFITKSGVNGFYGTSGIITFDVSNHVKSYYRNDSQTLSLASNLTNILTAQNLSAETIHGGTPVANASLSGGTQSMVIASNRVNTGAVQVTVTARDIFAQSASNAVSSSSVHIDSYAVESSARKQTAGTDFGTAGSVTFVNSTLDTTVAGFVGSTEIQYTGNTYRYPSTNYQNISPNGSSSDYNYSTLTGWRYADFQFSSLSNASSITITINGSTGITEKYGTANFKLYVHVPDIPGDGWLDANDAYSAGTPTGVNGNRAAVDVGGSATNTARRITFGTTPRNGTVTVRVGLNPSTSVTFTSITVS